MLNASALLLLMTSITCAQPNTASGDHLFPEWSELRPPVLLEPNPDVTRTPDGGWAVNGEPRFLIGQITYAGIDMGYRPTAGYPDELKWLYEQRLDYESAQRVGFDVMGTVVPTLWLRDYDPSYTSFFWPRNEVEAAEQFIANAKLPIFIDFTAAPWAHGNAVRGKVRQSIPDAAFNVDGYSGEGNHWVPYSCNTPEGREMWRKMWASGTKFAKDAGANVLIYELFNEPGYNDTSQFNRKLFAERMQEKFGTIEALNDAWGSDYADFEALSGFERQTESPGLYVEWGKFMEASFEDACRLGVETIQQVSGDPDAPVSVQSMDFREVSKYNINTYNLSRFLNVIQATTGGRNLLEAHFLRNIADGKPIVEGETYVYKSYDSIRKALWSKYARGFNASFLFKWDKRAWDQAWSEGDEEGGRKVGRQYPYLMLNPYATPTDALPGIMAFKREMLRVDDLFTPRDRGVDAEVALLLSYPTARLSRATGSRSHHQFDTIGHAIEYAHYPLDVIAEEQLPEGKLNGYRVLIVPGVDATYDDTWPAIDSWVRSGGTLVMTLEAMQSDEYGRARENQGAAALGIKLGKPVSSSVEPVVAQDPSVGSLDGVEVKHWRAVEADETWETLATAGPQPVLLQRPWDQGRVVLLNATAPAGHNRKIMDALLSRESLIKECVLTDAQTGEPLGGIEIHRAERDGQVGLVIFNQGRTPRAARLVLDGLPEGHALGDAVDLAVREADAEGGYPLLLPTSQPVVLVAAASDALAERLGEMEAVTASQGLADARAAVAEHEARLAARKQEQRFSYDVDVDRAVTLDLRKFANRNFEDRVPGDGKGGWTDQGENSLHEVEWGTHTLLGVPFEFIRWDHNAEKTTIVLASQKMTGVPEKVEGIPVGDRAKALYFLHASAWTGNQEGWRYIVHYSDGTSESIPIHGGKESGDWWLKGNTANPNGGAPVAWRNTENRGLYALQWVNPYPDKTIESLDIVSSMNNMIPLVVAITAERLGEEGEPGAQLDLFNDEGWAMNWRDAGWSGCSAAVVRTEGQPATIELRLKDPKEWSGVRWSGPAVTLPEAIARETSQLAFEVNAMTDEWGQAVPGHNIQVELKGLDASGKKRDGKMVGTRSYISPGGGTDNDPQTWQTVALPLERLVKSDTEAITDLTIQFRHGIPKAGLLIRDIRIESSSP